MIDVFHCRCLRSILGISWRDHITNDEMMAQSEQMALHNTVATRRRRFVGHILRLPTTRPASLALEWIPEGGRRRVGRPKRTWKDTLKEDLDVLGVDGMTQEILPTIVPDGDNSLSNFLLRTGGTKSKSKSSQITATNATCVKFLTRTKLFVCACIAKVPL